MGFNIKDEIDRATEAYLASAGIKVPEFLLKRNQMAESDEFLYADEYDDPRERDERELDDPIHAQCRNGRFVP